MSRAAVPSLATFWGPSVPYDPNTTSSAHRSETTRECDRSDAQTDFRGAITKRLFAAGVICAAALLAAGCSSSVDNPPSVTPTDPTSGSLPGSGSAAPYTPAPTAALFQPAQGVFPFPNDLYFSGTTDGTINIQPANGLIPNQAGLNALDGWSTTGAIRIRFGGALNPASFSAANIRVYQVTVSNTNKAVSGFTRPLTLPSVRRNASVA